MTINWKKDEINVRISRLLDTVVNLAMADDIITDEEEQLLQVIRKELWSLKDEFELMVAEEMSLDDATKRTKELFEQVIKKATAKAKEDGTITNDELILIDRIAKYLRNEDISEYLD